MLYTITITEYDAVKDIATVEIANGGETKTRRMQGLPVEDKDALKSHFEQYVTAFEAGQRQEKENQKKAHKDVVGKSFTVETIVTPQ
jgi:hypothetical protein